MVANALMHCGRFAGIGRARLCFVEMGQMANAKYLNLQTFFTGPSPHNAGVEGSRPSASTSLPGCVPDEVEGESPKNWAKLPYGNGQQSLSGLLLRSAMIHP